MVLPEAALASSSGKGVFSDPPSRTRPHQGLPPPCPTSGNQEPPGLSGAQQAQVLSPTAPACGLAVPSPQRQWELDTKSSASHSLLSPIALGTSSLLAAESRAAVGGGGYSEGGVVRPRQLSLWKVAAACQTQGCGPSSCLQRTGVDTRDAPMSGEPPLAALPSCPPGMTCFSPVTCRCGNQHPRLVVPPGPPRGSPQWQKRELGRSVGFSSSNSRPQPQPSHPAGGPGPGILLCFLGM